MDGQFSILNHFIKSWFLKFSKYSVPIKLNCRKLCCWQFLTTKAWIPGSFTCKRVGFHITAFPPPNPPNDFFQIFHVIIFKMDYFWQYYSVFLQISEEALGNLSVIHLKFNLNWNLAMLVGGFQFHFTMCIEVQIGKAVGPMPWRMSFTTAYTQKSFLHAQNALVLNESAQK